MSFVKLTEVEALEEIPEGVNIFAEVEGTIKRIPSEGLGGSDIRTAIIKKDGYDDALAGVAAVESAEVTFTCDNMTFDEAVQIIMSGGHFEAVLYDYSDGEFYTIPMTVIRYSPSFYVVPCIVLTDAYTSEHYWTSDGITNTNPDPATPPA